MEVFPFYSWKCPKILSKWFHFWYQVTHLPWYTIFHSKSGKDGLGQNQEQIQNLCISTPIFAHELSEKVYYMLLMVSCNFQEFTPRFAHFRGKKRILDQKFVPAKKKHVHSYASIPVNRATPVQRIALEILSVHREQKSEQSRMHWFYNMSL